MEDSNVTDINTGLFLTNTGLLMTKTGQIVSMEQVKRIVMNDGIPPKLARGTNNLWGYVDKDQEWIIYPRFKHANEFRDGKALVCSKGYWVKINEYGEWL